jgi:hypothetical protein
MLPVIRERSRARTLAALALLCGLCLPVAACSSLRVGADYDGDARFEKLHTWAWAPVRASVERSDARLRGESLHRRIQTEIEDDLEERGYRLAAGGERADFYVAYHVAIDDALDTRTMYRDYQIGPYFGRWSLPETAVERYDVGTLIIDVIDAARDELIFRGWAQADVDDLERSRRRNALIGDAVAEVLDRLPER